MGTKMHRGSSKRAALIGAAALPAIAGLSAALMSSSASNAAITVSITNEGVAHDSFNQTAAGWTSFLVTLVADPGNVIQSVDFGQDTNSTQGFFGPLLQNWKPSVTKSGTTYTPSPVDASENGQTAYGLDSHVVVTTGRVDVTAPFEDSNLVNPATPGVNNDTTDQYGTGTYLRGVFGIQGANQVANQKVAYLVLKDGTSATFRLSSTESVGGSFVLAGTVGGSGTTTPPANKIVSLTAVSGGAPATYGSKLTTAGGTTFAPNAPVTDSINVTGPGSGSYIPGFAKNVAGTGSSLFFVQVSGFNPGTDQEVYGLDLRHTTGGADTTAAEETTIAAEINASQAAGGIAVNAVPFASAPASLQALFPTYDIFLLTTGNPGTTQTFLGLDLSQETGVGGLQAINVAAVPEPASAAGILLGASGLLLGRRKRNA